MDRSKRELEALVTSQKDQLTRYEKRLKDVVTAYKGLLKEKEALETSLNAITALKETTTVSDATESSVDAAAKQDKTDGVMSSSSDVSSTASNIIEDKNSLQAQMMTLMNSLATLSAEKSRMEASFQSDKKQLRLQLSEKEKRIVELQQQQSAKEERAKLEVEEMRAKWIVERQEREKETNNQMLMIRELQKLYADERNLKENIEMQLNNFKTQFASQDMERSRLNELEQQLQEAKVQLKQLHIVDNQLAVQTDNTLLLQQLKQEMQQLKDQHAIALQNEQQRVLRAEEQSRQQAVYHEERVVNLEARLADLSSSVGKYDRLRQMDQQNIQILKQQLQEIEMKRPKLEIAEPTQIVKQSKQDIMSIVEQIVRLKKLLMQETAQTPQSFDISKIFAVHADHVECQEEFNRLQKQHDAAKTEIERQQELMEVQKSHIGTLQEKVKVLNRNIDEQELELKRQTVSRQQAIKEERAKWRQRLTELENEYRCKVNDLEQQLQKQRQRSLQLLDEKEQEIKALHNSFEIFHSNQMTNSSINNTGATVESSVNTSSDAESLDDLAPDSQHRKKSSIKAKKLSLSDNCHMLHYANESARKDIEISGLRKSKYAAETALRKAIQEKVTAQEHLNDKIEQLEEQIDRYKRCKTREGANLEYLKNVIISFIVTRDVEGKRHMLNAISAVLQFTPAEIQAINATFHKK